MMNTENVKIPHIDQNTIECDLSAFTRWLNRLADQVNWLGDVYLELKTQVDKNREDIRKINIRLDDITEVLNNHEQRITNLENIVASLDLDTIMGLIEMMNGRIDMLYSWLPVPYGMIDGLGWKFGMGNINVTSTTDAPSDVNGPGIYTSGAIEDNDINFK